MKSKRIKTLAYMALYMALFIVLKYVGDLIPILRMPNGGSIELEFIAIFIASYQLGWKDGIIVAVLSWLLGFIFGWQPYYVSPVQIILDYIGPLVVCGMASFWWPFKHVSKPAAAVLSAAIALAAYFGITKYWENSTASIIIGIIVAAGSAAFTYWYMLTRKKFGIVIAMLMKYVLQLLSGVYFWFPEGSAAGSTAAWIYSLGYNLWYNLVTMIICLFVVPMLTSRLEKANVKFAA